MSLNANYRIDTNVSFFLKHAHMMYLFRALTISWLPQNSSKPAGGRGRVQD